MYLSKLVLYLLTVKYEAPLSLINRATLHVLEMFIKKAGLGGAM